MNLKRKNLITHSQYDSSSDNILKWLMLEKIKLMWWNINYLIELLKVE